MNTIFYSPDHRLRAGWRLLVQMGIFVALLVVALFGMALALYMLGYKALPGSLLMSSLALAIATIGSVAIARRWLDKRSFSSLGLPGCDVDMPGDLLRGLGIALAMLGWVFLTMQRLGWLSVTGFHPASLPLALGWLALFCLVGYYEELLSRGYHLQTIASGTNLFWGVLLSSLLFGLLHLTNPGATLAGVLGITAAGLLLALAYLRTRRLWLSIGIHIGWNFCIAFLFGFPVSGLNIPSILTLRVTGPELWTGGAFGPEAGLIILPALAAGALLVCLVTQNQ